MSSHAQDIPGYPDLHAYDVREVALLPDFCRHTLLFRDSVAGGSDERLTQHWRSVLGPTFLHLHHYCWGLMKTHRGTVLAPDSQTRTAYLRDAVREFDYVIERAPDDFVLLPEILTRKAQNLFRLHRAPQAVGELERASALRADYWPAYAVLADHYLDEGRNDAARRTLEKGLAASPQATALQRRHARLVSRSAAAKAAR